MLVAAPAFAADKGTPQLAVSDLLNQLQSSQVEKDVCTSCHNTLDPAATFAADIKFSHGYHIRMQCSDCHSKFPHQKTGTQKPTMKICMNCHGVRHGPQGIIAKDNCDACHNTPRWQQSCPDSKIPDWAGKGHIAKGNAELNSKCAMCHKPAECTTCHDRMGVVWQPKNGWAYDPGESDGPKSGCYACHGNATLLATIAGGTQSFQVTGVEDSVHYKQTCQDCHPDFRYDDKPAATPLWNVNAGLQCGTCHQTLKIQKDVKPVAEYEKSIHAQKIRDGNYDSATCGSCHGGHFIYTLTTQEGKDKMHASAYRTCARCHQAQYASYDDYYHGKPYKDGAPDAPACWQCHASHNVLPQKDPASTVNSVNLGPTCGQQGCHKGSTEQFGAQAAQLIHRKGQVQEQNWLLQQIAKVRGLIGQ
jgi:hypothetical protein